MRLQKTIILKPNWRQAASIRKTLLNFQEGVRQIFQIGAEYGNFNQTFLTGKVFYRPTQPGKPYSLENNLGLNPIYVTSAKRYVSEFAMMNPGQVPAYSTIPLELMGNTLRFVDPSSLILETVDGPILLNYQDGPPRHAVAGTTNDQMWLTSPRQIDIVWDPYRSVCPTEMIKPMPTDLVPHKTAWLDPMRNKIDQITNLPDKTDWVYQRKWVENAGLPLFQSSPNVPRSSVTPSRGGIYIMPGLRGKYQ